MADDEIFQCPICHGGGQLSWDDTPEGLFPNLPLEGDTLLGLRRNGRGEPAIGGATAREKGRVVRQEPGGGTDVQRFSPRSGAAFIVPAVVIAAMLTAVSARAEARQTDDAKKQTYWTGHIGQTRLILRLKSHSG